MRRETAIVLAAYGGWLLILFLLMASTDRGIRNVADMWLVLLVWGPLLVIATLTVAAWVERRIKRR